VNDAKSYFFCGIGGSGMLPLATIVQARGHQVAGSDRSLDQGRLAPKFDDLKRRGVALFPQDGSGPRAGQILVASAAVEDSVPDVVRARALGLPRLLRAELLAELFNAAPQSIAVGGTSGKSSVTGMIGWILHALGRDPTVMNGAVMKNFAAPDRPFASALAGHGMDFVSEVDESDGSIALYRPTVAALNNVTLDHKSMDELRALFAGFLAAAEQAVVNLDDPEARALAAAVPPARLIGTGFASPDAALRGGEVDETAQSIAFTTTWRGDEARVALQVPGRHNAANALVALGAVLALGVPLGAAAQALAGFAGLRRRYEVVGSALGVTVIDDFAHNPDKIAATLATARTGLEGRLLLFFQPHGYGPLKVMRDELVACFAHGMAEDDLLLLCDPIYYGGTTDRSVGSGTIAAGVQAAGRTAEHLPERAACGARLAAAARPGDRILVMGARDDTLTLFAEELLAALAVEAE
jgi:UDP-N-acetylmuramate--alanine ligase